MSELRPLRPRVLALVAALLSQADSTLGTRTVEIASNDGTYIVEYESQPADVPLNEPFAIVLRVLEAGEERAPARDVELHFDARMPEHRHGMRVRPAVEAQGDGRFRIEGALLHMPGAWELHFDLTRGPITERAQARVELE